MSENKKLTDKELEEVSVTGAIDGCEGPPKTPYAFQSKPKRKKDKANSLIKIGGIFSLVLCIDDMFLLHDRYIPEYIIYPVYISLIQLY